MLLKNGVYQAHIRLARDGDTVDGNLVTENAPPDFTPTANWSLITESIATFSRNPNKGEAKNVMKTVGGRRVMKRQIYTGPAMLEISWEQHDSSDIVVELLSLSGKIDTSAATTPGSFASYVPLAKTTSGIRGWFHIQQYNDMDQIDQIEMVFGELNIDTESQDGDDIRKPKLKLTVYYNALGEGRIYNNSTTEVI